MLLAHRPEVGSEAKNHEKLSIHFQADLEKIETIFRTITSVHQRSFYGAVAEMCEQCETFDDRTGKPVVMGASKFHPLVLSVIKTEVPLDCDCPANQDLLLPHGLENELRSCHNKTN